MRREAGQRFLRNQADTDSPERECLSYRNYVSGLVSQPSPLRSTWRVRSIIDCHFRNFGWLAGFLIGSRGRDSRRNCFSVIPKRA